MEYERLLGVRHFSFREKIGMGTDELAKMRATNDCDESGNESGDFHSERVVTLNSKSWATARGTPAREEQQYQTTHEC